jgi:hypothetical protein
MRIHSGVGRAGLGLILLAGCSTSEPIIETATVRTAPPTTIGPITEPLVLTIPKIVKTAPPTIPSTGPTTVPVDAAGSTLISGPTITEDEAAIKLVIEKQVRASLEARYKETFDPAPFEGIVGDQFLKDIEADFNAKRAKSEIRRPGTILQVITPRIKITDNGTKATAIACNRNDIQVWNDNGNSDPTDDTMTSSELTVGAKGTGLSKINGKWLVITAETIGVKLCDGLF